MIVDPGGTLPLRMLLPPIVDRREIDRHLAEFFRLHRVASFNRAIAGMCRFYGVKRPRIEWFEYLDWGKTAGRTFEDGRIHLVHPSIWKRGIVYYSERLWVQMIYHEMGHYILWTDAERKADMFARRMVDGIASVARVVRSRPRRRASAKRAASARARMRSKMTRSRRTRASRTRTRSRRMRAVA